MSPSPRLPALAWNYAKTAWRKMRRERGAALINIIGLAVGMACAILIFLYVRHESGYDRFHAKRDRIFRLAAEMDGTSSQSIAKVPGPWGPAAAAEIPGVERAVRFVFVNETLVSRGEKRFYEKGGFYADPSLFDVFSFPLLRGNPAAALAAPHTVVLTETFARKYFGSEEPLGRTLTFDAKDEYLVTGVLADVPSQSHLAFDFLVSMATYANPQRDDWQWTQFYTYLLVKPGAAPGDILSKFPALLKRSLNPAVAARYKPFLQPLTGIHLHSHLFREMQPNSDAGQLAIFSALAVFILFIAGINFMNLATARAGTRSKEVGVRKAAGADRRQLIGQFLAESILISLAAAGLALVLVALILPVFASLAGKALTLGRRDLALICAGGLGLALAVGTAAGSYPAFVLSSYRPARALQGRSRGGRRARLRQGLVIFQFAISAFLIIATGIITRQLGYVRAKSLGFDISQMVLIPIRDDSVRSNLEDLKQEVRRSPGVLSVAASGNLPGGGDWGMPVEPEGIPRDKVPPMRILAVDRDFVATFGMELAAGRDFSASHPSDSTGAFLINEEAARQLGWREPVGKTIALPSAQRPSAPVIGVLKDFHFRSLREKIGPVLLFIPPPGWMAVVSVKLRPDRIPATLAFLEKLWARFDPAHPFSYAFMDEQFARLYESEKRTGRLLGAFAALAVSIACLGLFGLAAFSSEQRTKEIGIRKVLGASAGSIVVWLSKDFAKLILIGVAAAAAPAALAMGGWLGHFAYRVRLGPGVFILAGVLAFGVGVLTVSSQAIKAARMNPADSLRGE